MSCSYEENRIIPESTLGSRQMVIPTSSPAFPCYCLTSSRDRQGSPPPLYFAICQCHLKSFHHHPSLRQSYGSSYCKPILSRIKPLFFSFFFFKFSYDFGRIRLLLLTGLFLFHDTIQLGRDHRWGGWLGRATGSDHAPLPMERALALPTLKSGASPQCTKHIPN